MFLKEIFDKVVAFIALIILLPLFLIVAVLINSLGKHRKSSFRKIQLATKK